MSATPHNRKQRLAHTCKCTLTFACLLPISLLASGCLPFNLGSENNSAFYPDDSPLTAPSKKPPAHQGELFKASATVTPTNSGVPETTSETTEKNIEIDETEDLHAGKTMPELRTTELGVSRTPQKMKPSGKGMTATHSDNKNHRRVQVSIPVSEKSTVKPSQTSHMMPPKSTPKKSRVQIPSTKKPLHHKLKPVTLARPPRKKPSSIPKKPAKPVQTLKQKGPELPPLIKHHDELPPPPKPPVQ